jgi:hypothetical protein
MSSPTLVIVDRREPAATVSSLATSQSAAAAPGVSLSALDRVRIRLAFEHDRHATGPVFPCPLCFRRTD